MLTNTEKLKHQSSTSRPFGASGRSSRELEQGSPPANYQNQDMIRRDCPQEIQAAQRILARIAVRILHGRKTNEAK
jgi:hypothetical protein